MKILIIEDDLKIINFLKKGLEEECYIVDFATNGDEGLYLATVNEYDLILLDIMIPIKDGIEVCKSLRGSNIQTPIIMLTAKDSIEDKIKGLDIGANYRDWETDRKSTRLNSSHSGEARMPSSA